MYMRISGSHVLILACGLAFTVVTGAVAATTGSEVPQNLVQGIAKQAHIVPLTAYLNALQSGSLVAYSHTLTKYHVGPVLSKLGYLELNHQPISLLSEAEQCERSQLANNKNGSSTVIFSLYCNELAVAASVKLGNAHALMSNTMWSYRKLRPALHRAAPAVFPAESTPPTADASRVVAFSPPVIMRWTATMDKLSVSYPRREVDSVPSVPISVNGHEVKAEVDFGGLSGQVAPLVVITDKAHSPILASLGLSDLTPRRDDGAGSQLDKRSKRAITRNNWLRSMARSGRPVVQALTVGPLTMHDVMVSVLKSSATAPGIYITDSLLSRFGSVTFGEHRIRLSRNGTNACTRPVRMTYASDENLRGGFIFPVSVNGHATYAGLDLGVSGVVRRVNDAAVPSAPAGDARSAGRASGEAVLVQVGATTIRAPIAGNVLTPKGVPETLDLGSGVLANYRVTLSFRGAYPSLCLAKW